MTVCSVRLKSLLKCANVYLCHHRSIHSNAPKRFEDIPGPKLFPIIGNLHLFSTNGPYRLDTITEAWADLHQKYGQIVRLKLGQDIISTSNADDVELIFRHQGKYPQRPNFDALLKYRKSRKQSSGIITGFGQEWLRLRSSVNWMMRPKAQQPYFQHHFDVAEDFVRRICRMRHPQHYSVPDFLHELYLFTQESIGVVVFGSRLGILEDSEFGQQVIGQVDNFLHCLCETLLRFPYWKLFTTTTYLQLQNSLDFFIGLCKKKLAEGESEFAEKLRANGVEDEEDIALIMQEIFMAGVDATGNALVFLLYHLAKNAPVQSLLRQECETLWTNNSKPNFESVQKLQYLSACIKESFRLTPTAGGNVRILDSEAILSGYRVPKGTICLGNSPIIGTDCGYYEQPTAFKPERWLRDKHRSMEHHQQKHHPFAHIHFGHGVRKCVGHRFADQEIKLCIILLLRNFEIKLFNSSEAIKVKTRLQLMPDRPLTFQFIDR